MACADGPVSASVRKRINGRLRQVKIIGVHKADTYRSNRI
jgi:hypothetical protein